jgi:hypothetical protein
MKLETIFSLLENPKKLTPEELQNLQHYLISLQEKITLLNKKYNLSIELSDYVTSFLKKEEVAV